MIDHGNFEKALKHLELQNDNLQTLDDALPVLLKEAVAESVIQRFETCYDCLWKVLKRYLDEELGLPEAPDRATRVVSSIGRGAGLRVPRPEKGQASIRSGPGCFHSRP